MLAGFDPIDEIPITRASETDDYQSCHDKVFHVLEHNDGSEADWFIIADDDTWLHPANLYAMLSALPVNEPVLAGQVCPARMDGGRPDILHAHGGAGMILSAAALRSLRAVTRPWPRHSRFSDVSLAMLATQTPDVRCCFIHNMHGPDVPLCDIDPREAISIHVKDRASFADLYSAAGLA